MSTNTAGATVRFVLIRFVDLNSVVFIWLKFGAVESNACVYMEAIDCCTPFGNSAIVAQAKTLNVFESN